MGIKETIKKIGRSGKLKEGCSFNQESQTWHCFSKRIHADGTEEDRGGIDVGFDGACNPIVSNAYETEEGTVDRLNKKFVSRIISTKCKSNRPQDY